MMYRALGVSGLTLALLLSGTTLSVAQELGYPCGRVTRYTAPTATADGSVTVGTRRFVARAGSLPEGPPAIAVGVVLCLTGEVDASGAFTRLRAAGLGEQAACGAVTAFTPTTSTTRGTLAIQPHLIWTLPVRTGTTFTQSQLAGAHCYKFEIDADGNAEIVGYHGPVQPNPAVPSATPVRQLPSTSTTPRTRRCRVSDADGRNDRGVRHIGIPAIAAIPLDAPSNPRKAGAPLVFCTKRSRPHS